MGIPDRGLPTVAPCRGRSRARMPVAHWRVGACGNLNVARASLPVICIGNSHGQGCPWHLAGACPCAWSGTRTAREGGQNRGFVDSASARRCNRLFVAARLPAPTGVGPAARRPPRNAEAFRYKMRRRCIRAFVDLRIRPLRDDVLPFRSGAASRADGSGPRNWPAPLGTRRRSATKYLPAMHSGIRGFVDLWIPPLRGDAIAFS